jgi:hypothetical protein
MAVVVLVVVASRMTKKVRGSVHHLVDGFHGCKI